MFVFFLKIVILYVFQLIDVTNLRHGKKPTEQRDTSESDIATQTKSVVQPSLQLQSISQPTAKYLSNAERQNRAAVRKKERQ